MRRRVLPALALFAAVLPAWAQDSDHSKHGTPGGQAEPTPMHVGHGEPAPQQQMPEGHTAPSAQPQAHEEHGSMGGVLGNYAMTRDSSGTSWVPGSTPMDGVNGMLGDWSTMLHGFVNLVYDHQGGPRGDTKTFSESMLMGMAQHQWNAHRLTLRGMISLDPLMGKSGYPLIFQTGETANGVDPLIDRQHPHDFFMELAAIYSVPLGGGSGFVYVGYPGEPALGPPAFPHRFSGMDSPEAPLGHHWLDATHITFGVLTAGYVWDRWKIEASAFKGREPDEHRWDFDSPRLDSGAARLTFNPNENWSFQISWGYLRSPEQLEPEVDQRRTTASAIYNVPFARGNWQTTLTWGRNDKSPGATTDALLLETAVNWDRNTVFARGEITEKDELFGHDDPLHGRIFRVSKLSLGYVYDIPVAEHLALGIGALGSVYDFPGILEPDYGDSPTSYMLFARLKLH
ncbi:MAG: hypothetical protein ACT4OG_04255 [Alphaproteobacteria bacterium]